MSETPSNTDGLFRLRDVLAVVFGVLLAVLVLATVYTSSIVDGDLFWQMVYGRYFWEAGTLVPDHTIFTWSKSGNEVIYCAWLAETAFYFLHEAGGIPALYVLRYLTLIAVMGGLCLLGRANKVAPATLAFFSILFLVGSSVGAYMKPELFSLFFISVCALALYGFKSHPTSRLWKALLMASPLFLVLWVNSHGGFIFASVLYGAFLVGELANYFTKRPCALDKAGLKLVFILCAGIGISVFISPYGYHYPLQLIQDRIMSENNTEMMNHVAAWQPSLQPLFRNLMTRETFACLVALNLLVVGVTRKLDFTVILHNLAFAALFVVYVRATYYWPIIALASLIYLLKDREIGPKMQLAGLVVAAALAFRMSYFFVYHPTPNEYWGMGPSYINPVLSGELVKSLPRGARLANDYGNGGYLMWALYPDKKVMIDPRGFPFRKWWPLYMEFISADDTEHFLKATESKVVVLSHSKGKLIKTIDKLPEWRLVLIEPGAVVFFHNDLKDETLAKKLQEQSYWHLKHPRAGRKALKQAVGLGRFEIAGKYLDRIEQLGEAEASLAALRRYYEAKLALHEKRYDDALEKYEELKKHGQLNSTRVLASLYEVKIKKLEKLGKMGEANGYRQKLEALPKPK